MDYGNLSLRARWEGGENVERGGGAPCYGVDGTQHGVLTKTWEEVRADVKFVPRRDIDLHLYAAFHSEPR